MNTKQIIHILASLPYNVTLLAVAFVTLCALPDAVGGQIFVASSGGTIGEYDATTGATVNAALVSGLDTLWSLAASGSNLFVTNGPNGNNMVSEYTTSGATVSAALISGLNTAQGLAASGSNLFVVVRDDHVIGKYTTSGATVNAALVSGVATSLGVVVSGENLYLAYDTTISEYNATTGATINAALVTGLHGAEGIVVSGGNLFVVNFGAPLTNGNGSIGEYNATTGATVNAALVTGLNNPHAIAVVPEPSSLALTMFGVVGLVAWGWRRRADSTTVRLLAVFVPIVALCVQPPIARGQIFVSSVNGPSGIVGEYDVATGAPVNASLISGLSSPEGLVVSGSNLFVASFDSATIGKYTTAGTPINAALVSGLNAPNNFTKSGSTLFVSNFSSSSVGEYDANTGAPINAALLSLNSPGGIAVSGGKLFVVSLGAGPGTGTINEYDATTGATVQAPLISGLNSPEGLVMSGSNLFVVNHGTFSNGSYVADSGSIGEYTTSGQPVNAALVSGLNYPRQIAESGGNLFVTNFHNGTVGEYNATTGATINAALVSGLNNPIGIAAIVPEPSSLALAAFGVAGLAALRRRRAA